MEQLMSAGTPENIVGVISKLLTDLVARNDQARHDAPAELGEEPYSASSVQERDAHF